MRLPMNKLQSSLKELNKEDILFKQFDNEIVIGNTTTLFTDKDTITSSNLKAIFDSRNNKVTIITKLGKQIFNFNSSIDVRTLLPILLLSK
ncbi:entry [Cetacean poxvirus 1]|nr:entry [Cetacean poxvirus 1]